MNALNSLVKKTHDDIRKQVELLTTERDELKTQRDDLLEERKYAQSTILQLEAQTMRTNRSSLVKTDNDICKKVKLLILERDDLLEERKYAQSTILELEAQTIRSDRLLSQALAALETTIETVPAFKSPPKARWIRSIWLSSTANPTLLKPVETAWQRGDTQQALILLKLILKRENLTNGQRVEAILLQATIMTCSEQSNEALLLIEDALKIATAKQLDDLVGKAQFIRGRCYVDLKRYADAKWCFVLASHTKGYEALIETNMHFAKELIGELPAGDVGRKLTLPVL